MQRGLSLSVLPLEQRSKIKRNFTHTAATARTTKAKVVAMTTKVASGYVVATKTLE